MHVCITSSFTSSFMLQTFYFVISRGGAEDAEPTPTQRHSMPVYATGVESPWAWYRIVDLAHEDAEAANERRSNLRLSFMRSTVAVCYVSTKFPLQESSVRNKSSVRQRYMHIQSAQTMSPMILRGQVLCTMADNGKRCGACP